MAAAAHGDKTSSFFFKDPEFSPPKISLHSHTETTDAKNDDMQHLSEAESPVILVERDAGTRVFPINIHNT